MSTELCKKAIVEYLEIEENMREMLHQFHELAFEDGTAESDPAIVSEIEKMEWDALQMKNWKRKEKQVFHSNIPAFAPLNGSIERCFNCEPFDDQLRAYVYERNGVIIHVSISPE
jgi:hypothetical protein